MGNWYEERWAPNQPFREQFGTGEVKKIKIKQKRKYESDIALATNKGELKALNRINRNPKWDTNGVIPNDGYVKYKHIIMKE